MLKVTRTNLPEVLVLEYEEHYESRGSFCLNFSKQLLDDAGISIDFVEERVYCPQKAGTLYGIHFQNNPKPQAKLLYCIQGSGLDYAVDLRRGSPTYKQWVCVQLSSDNRKQMLIPHGFGHAFLSLEDNTRVILKIDTYFEQEYSRGIAWNDPELNIAYPAYHPILAQHDIDAPMLNDSDCNL